MHFLIEIQEIVGSCKQINKIWKQKKPLNSVLDKVPSLVDNFLDYRKLVQSIRKFTWHLSESYHNLITIVIFAHQSQFGQIKNFQNDTSCCILLVLKKIFVIQQVTLYNSKSRFCDIFSRPFSNFDSIPQSHAYEHLRFNVSVL